jgi:hypothetical protein
MHPKKFTLAVAQQVPDSSTVPTPYLTIYNVTSKRAR